VGGNPVKLIKKRFTGRIADLVNKIDISKINEHFIWDY